jgi:hypothetical protein
VANDIYIEDYPEPDQADMYELELEAFQKALTYFLRSSLIDYLATTVGRSPTPAEAREMADRAQALLQEARLRGWTDPAGDA